MLFLRNITIYVIILMFVFRKDVKTMGAPVLLNGSEKELKRQLEQYSRQVWSIIEREADNDYDLNYIQKLYEDMASTANNLHMSLENRGIHVKHHKYMLENRGCSPREIKFYEHIHPVDDLLDFLEDQNANDDPEDVTINVEFTMKIYSRRWGHDDLYEITRTSDGWFLKALTFNGPCGKDASPVLYKSLDHDGICYPKQIGSFFEWLWEKANEDGLSKKEVQHEIDNLGKWISQCEKKVPRGIFEGLI